MLSQLTWIALAILGVHVVVAFVVIIYARKSYSLLEERTSVIVEAADNMNRFGERAHYAIKILTGP